ncbi:MAG TPA: GAF domain-containing protein [Jatrophihabitans sp.]|jgi:transcriptional regulator with GAF, ATPase, and Fis domain|nr:GAF domain-containing protein [Jatrophihabitans sp.]
MWLTDKPRKGLWRGVNGAASISLAVLGGWAAVTHGAVRALLVGGAVTVTGIQQISQWARDKADEQATGTAEMIAEEIRSTTNAALSGAFMPLLRLLAKIEEAENETERAKLREAAIASVVHAAPAVLGPDNTRACFFVLENDSSDGSPRLRFHTAAGRVDEPHTRFEPSTAAGRAAFGMLVKDEYTFCEDTMASPPTGWEDHTHQYRTFLSVPVRGDLEIVGMLTVDAPSPGDLNLDRDLPILLVLARILAVSQIAQSE